jgi:hypothetical protein
MLVHVLLGLKQSACGASKVLQPRQYQKHGIVEQADVVVVSVILQQQQ